MRYYFESGSITSLLYKHKIGFEADLTEDEHVNLYLNEIHPGTWTLIAHTVRLVDVVVHHFIWLTGE